MSVKSIFAAIKKELEVTPTQRARELDFPSGYEPGLCHPDHHSHVLCRDDQVVEIAGGPSATVLADGSDGHVSVKGTSVTLEAQYLHLHAPAGGLYFGYQRFNPYWLSSPGPEQFDPVSILRKSPLTLSNPLEILGPLHILTAEAALNPALIAQGVIPRPLVSLFTPVPLFGPNEQLLILSRNLVELIKNVAVPGL
jgi:hypothetical protein